MWRDFASAAVGQWIHIFPEAGIWQHEDGRLEVETTLAGEAS